MNKSERFDYSCTNFLFIYSIAIKYHINLVLNDEVSNATFWIFSSLRDSLI